MNNLKEFWKDEQKVGFSPVCLTWKNCVLAVKDDLEKHFLDKAVQIEKELKLNLNKMVRKVKDNIKSKEKFDVNVVMNMARKCGNLEGQLIYAKKLAGVEQKK